MAVGRGGGPQHGWCVDTSLMDTSLMREPTSFPCEAPLACLERGGKAETGANEARWAHSCQSGGGCRGSSGAPLNSTRSHIRSPPVGGGAGCALRRANLSFRQRFRGPLERFMFAAVLGVCLRGGHSQCTDSSLRPTLSTLSPQTLPWEGGTLTLTGGNFGASSVSPPEVKIEGGICVNTTVHSDTRITCMPAATSVQSASVFLTAGGCTSVNSIPLSFTGFPWAAALQWIPQPQPEGGPLARYGHVMVEDGAGGAILHGGLGTSGLFADVFRYGTAGVWAEVSTTEAGAGARPAARTEHAGAVVGNTLVVFGGWNAGLLPGEAPLPANASDVPDGTGDPSGTPAALFSSTHALNLASGTWRVVTPLQEPAERRGASAAGVSAAGGWDASLFLFGGHESTEQGSGAASVAGALVPNALHRLTVPALAWSLVPLVANQSLSQIPPQLAYSALVALPESRTLYLSGGMDATGELASSIWRCALQATPTDGVQWTQFLPVGGGGVVGWGRMQHTMGLVGSRLLLQGGWQVPPVWGGCVASGWHGDERWSDMACATRLGAVCKRDAKANATEAAAAGEALQNASLVVGSVGQYRCQTLRISGTPAASGAGALLGEYIMSEQLSENRPVFRASSASGVRFLFFLEGYWAVAARLSLDLSPASPSRVDLYTPSSGLEPPLTSSGAEWWEVSAAGTDYQAVRNVTVSCQRAVACDARLFSGHCWSLLPGDEQLSFAEANALCAARGEGSALASILSEAQDAWARSLSDGSAFWIGLARASASHTLAWVDREPLSYTKWRVGEPDGRGWPDALANGAEARTGVWFVPPAAGASSGGVWQEAAVQCGEAPVGASQTGGASVNGGFVVFGGADSASGAWGGTVQLVALEAGDMARASPDVVAVLPAVAAPGTSVVVQGAGLCRLGLTVRVGEEACVATAGVSHSLARCTLPDGVGTGHAVTAQAPGMTAGATSMFAYLPPVVFAVSPTRSLLAGGVVLTVTGRFLGRALDARNVTVGGLPCGGAAWVSASTVTCIAPSSNETRTAPVVVRVGGQASGGAVLFLYVHPVWDASPVVTLLSPQSGRALGGVSLIINGSDLSLVSSVLVGTAACIKTKGSSTFVQCFLGPVLGASLQLTLTLGVLGGMTRAVSMGASPTFTVLAPRVSGIVSRQVQGGFPTTGALVAVRGSNFGGFASEIGVTIGATAATDVLWISDGEIWCRAAPGVGRALALAVHVAWRPAEVPASVTLSYNAPLVLSVSPSLAPASGATPLTILGRGFGPAAAQVSVEVQGGDGEVRTLNHTLISDTTVTLSLPGGLASDAAVAEAEVVLLVAVDVAGQRRLARVAAVAASSILSLTVALPFVPRLFRERLAEVVWPEEDAWDRVHIAEVVLLPLRRRGGLREQDGVAHRTGPPRRAEEEEVQVEARLLAAVGDPAGGDAGLAALRATVARCCASDTCEAGAAGCSSTCTTASPTPACSAIAALGSFSLVLQPAEAGGGVPVPPAPPSTTPKEEAGGAGVPGWLPPVLGIGGAALCLLCVAVFLMRSEFSMSTKLEEDSDEDQDDDGEGSEAGDPAPGFLPIQGATAEPARAPASLSLAEEEEANRDGASLDDAEIDLGAAGVGHGPALPALRGSAAARALYTQEPAGVSDSSEGWAPSADGGVEVAGAEGGVTVEEPGPGVSKRGGWWGAVKSAVKKGGKGDARWGAQDVPEGKAGVSMADGLGRGEARQRGGARDEQAGEAHATAATSEGQSATVEVEVGEGGAQAPKGSSDWLGGIFGGIQEVARRGSLFRRGSPTTGDSPALSDRHVDSSSEGTSSTRPAAHTLPPLQGAAAGGMQTGVDSASGEAGASTDGGATMLALTIQKPLLPPAPQPADAVVLPPRRVVDPPHGEAASPRAVEGEAEAMASAIVQGRPGLSGPGGSFWGTGVRALALEVQGTEVVDHLPSLTASAATSPSISAPRTPLFPASPAASAASAPLLATRRHFEEGEEEEGGLALEACAEQDQDGEWESFEAEQGAGAATAGWSHAPEDEAVPGVEERGTGMVAVQVETAGLRVEIPEEEDAPEAKRGGRGQKLTPLQPKTRTQPGGERGRAAWKNPGTSPSPTKSPKQDTPSPTKSTSKALSPPTPKVAVEGGGRRHQGAGGEDSLHLNPALTAVRRRRVANLSQQMARAGGPDLTASDPKSPSEAPARDPPTPSSSPPGGSQRQGAHFASGGGGRRAQKSRVPGEKASPLLASRDGPEPEC